MATKILINGTRLGTIQAWPGSYYDSVNDAADIASLQAAGGVLFDSSNAVVAAASLLAQAVRRRGGPLAEAESIMQSAVLQSFASANVHELFANVEADATPVGTIAENVLTASPSAQPGCARTLDIVFAAGWEGGDITVYGVDAQFVAVSETFASPGIGGGTVNGTKVFSSIVANGIVNSTAGGTGAESATVQLGAGIGVSKPVTLFIKLSVDGVQEAFSSTDTTEGWFVPTTTPTGLLSYEVWYTPAY